MYISIDVCVYVYLYMYLHMYMYMRMNVYVCEYIHECFKQTYAGEKELQCGPRKKPLTGRWSQG